MPALCVHLDYDFHLCQSLSLVLSSFSDRTVKIWRARGGLDSTLEAVDNVDEVASN